MCTSPFCETCDTDKDVCDSCINGYYSDGAGNCYAVCPDGYGFDEDTDMCVTCQNANCLKCADDYQECTECASDKYLKSG